MSILEALVLGVVQGLTEFLPVSSSGHLVLLQKIFGIEEPVLLFDTLVHTGTLAAVCIVLRRDIWDILRKLVQPLTLYLVIGTVPAVIAALLFSEKIEKTFTAASFLGFSFMVTSALLVLSELWPKRKTSPEGKPEKKMNWINALVTGIFQAIAIVPGISRSGATLSAGLFCGLKRDNAVRFAFLLSIPAILGALVFQLKNLFFEYPGLPGPEGMTAIGAAPIITGAVSAAVVGFFSVKFMLKIVREKSLLGFGVYTGLLGILILVDRFATHFFF